MRTLSEAFAEIADFLHLDADALNAYAAEDTCGGFDFDSSKSRWPGGSLWEVEGKTLYALSRALKPALSLELGTYHGASTAHLLAAGLQNGDAHGWLESIDRWEGAGDLVPTSLRQHWRIGYTEAVDYLRGRQAQNGYQMVFEDCIHSESEVYAIVTALRPHLDAGAVVIHHDSEHGDDGQQIQRALTRAGLAFRSWLIEPSDCGIAIWRHE
jgi:predicted O-methyltransferase YrrM